MDLSKTMEEEMTHLIENNFGQILEHLLIPFSYLKLLFQQERSFKPGNMSTRKDMLFQTSMPLQEAKFSLPLQTLGIKLL